MPITKERFDQGMVYQDYLAQMTRNRERLEENFKTVQIAQQELDYFTSLPNTINVVAIVEDWCGDVINNLPVLTRIAEDGGKLSVRMFLRDQNPDLINQYLKEGKYASIPVFVFFDQEFRELGHWIERPAEITRQMEAYLHQVQTTDPAFEGVTIGDSPATLPDAARNRLMQAYGEFRAQSREQADREVVRELRELIERGIAQARGA